MFGGADTQNLQKISSSNVELETENDRLKTTCMILSQKLKLQEDESQVEIDKLQSEVNQFRESNFILKGSKEEIEKELHDLKK